MKDIYYNLLDEHMNIDLELLADQWEEQQRVLEELNKEEMK